MNPSTVNQIRSKRWWPVGLALALALFAVSLAAAWLAKPVRASKAPPSAGLAHSAPQLNKGPDQRELHLPVKAAKDGDIRKEPSAAAPFAEPLPLAAGSIVYVDPVTGRFGAPPPGVAAALFPANDGFSTSGEGLVVTKSATPGGGIMIDLQGRFQNAMTITTTPEGKLSSACTMATSPGEAAKADGVGTAKAADKP